MDTTWFAVDADGKIGRFDTGEAGALPTAAACGNGAIEASFDEFLFHAACAARILVTPSDERRRTTPFRSGRAIVVLEPAVGTDYRSAPVASPLPKQSHVLREASPRIVMTGELSADELNALARDPGIREVWTEDELWDLLDGTDRGTFDFGHDDYGNPGSYKRDRVPEKPMTLADLPESIRKDVGAVSLPIRFAETEALHLADHVKDEDASTWGDVGLRGDRVPPPPPQVLERPIDWWRIAIVLFAVLGIAWLLSRR
jgi:hypothetical protein